MDPSIPRLLKVANVAAVCDLSPARIYELIREGILPAVHFGRQVRVSEAELQRFVDQRGAPLLGHDGVES